MSDPGCKRVRWRFPALVGGDLPEETSAELIQHLLVCSDCASEFECVKRIWDAIGDVPEVVPSAEFDRKLRNRIEHGSGERHSLFAVFSVRYAGVLLMTVAVGTATGHLLARRTAERAREEKSRVSDMLWEPVTALGDDPLVAAYRAYFNTLKESRGAK